MFMESHKENHKDYDGWMYWIPTSYLRNRIIGAIHSSSRGAVDEERKVALLFMFDDQLLQLGRDHLSSERLGVRRRWQHAGQTQQTLERGGWGRDYERIMEQQDQIKVKLCKSCEKGEKERERGGKFD